MAAGSLSQRHLSRGATEHYSDPAYYSKAYAARREDIAYYVALASAVRGRVLEYGAGNGRVTLPLARAGCSVTAVDHSAPMLADLKARLRQEPPEVRRRITLRRGDMRRVRLRERFGLVIAPFNTVLHLYERRDWEALLARVAEHSSARARFVFDWSVPRCADLCLDAERWFGGPRFIHPSTQQRVRYAERFFYAPLTQVLSTWMRFTPESGASWQTLLTQRQYFPREIEGILSYNGFTDQRWTGDFTDAPPSNVTQTLVVSCRRRGALA